MRVLLDACVLYPTVLREILLSCAGAGMFTPLWSTRILEEWRSAALRNHPENALALEDERALVLMRFPQAIVTPGAEDVLSLPDENDRHVLAAAIAGHAQMLVTLNLRDFPGRTLARYGVSPRHPDSLLCELYDDDAKRVSACVVGVAEQFNRDTGQGASLRALLKRARVPKLGKRLAES